MADFDNFENADQPQQEEDPAAEFLAREQDQMAELEDDNFVSAEPPEAEDTFTGGQFEEPPAGGADDLFDPLAAPPSDNFQVQNGDADDMFGVTSIPEDDFERQADDPYSSIASVDKQRQEPEKIRIWREEQKERLEQKDKESEVKKAEWREIAKKELEDWYKHSAEQLEKAKVNNREAETVFVQERDENVPGHEWERICRLCEFNPKQARNAKDVSRMRSILLQLKQTPFTRS